MARDSSVNGTDGIAPTETTPLLDDQPKVPDVSISPVSGESSGDEHQNADEADVREGLPEVAAKMHLILPAIGIGIYLCAVDQLLTVATYAKIGTELHALNNTSWIATAYFLTLTSFQPLYGKLSDIFGRKECLLFAYTIFGLGCLGCGLANNITQLCIARAIAGIGGGGMNSVVSILITDIVPLRERGVWQGYINIIFAAGTSTGAPLGGLLADSVGWRWSFLGQVPLCLAAFLAVTFFLHLPKTDHAHWRAKVSKIDFLGAFTLILAVAAILVGLDAGSNYGWTDTITLVGLISAPIFFAIFIFVEMRIATNPFAPGHIIFDKALFACYLANFFGVAGQVAPIFFAPLFFQAVQGMSATQSGAMLIPSMVMAVIASIAGGVIIKKTGRYFWVTVTGFSILLLSLAPVILCIWFQDTWGVTLGLALTALGAGSGITTTLIALLANAAPTDTAVVIACSYLFRSLGSSLGISTGSAVLQQVLHTQLATRLPPDMYREIEERVRESLDEINLLPSEIANQVRASYRVGCVGALTPAVVFLAAALAATFFMNNKVVGR